ncbi:hypothetical protein GCM10027440_35580 [Nocardiopsis coralliicola]
MPAHRRTPRGAPSPRRPQEQQEPVTPKPPCPLELGTAPGPGIQRPGPGLPDRRRDAEEDLMQAPCATTMLPMAKEEETCRNCRGTGREDGPPPEPGWEHEAICPECGGTGWTTY